MAHGTREGEAGLRCRPPARCRVRGPGHGPDRSHRAGAAPAPRPGGLRGADGGARVRRRQRDRRLRRRRGHDRGTPVVDAGRPGARAGAGAGRRDRRRGRRSAGRSRTRCRSAPAGRLRLRDRWTRTIDRDALAARLGSVGLIDARATERYRGDLEPVDAAPGHIPTARSLPATGNLGPDGRFLDPDGAPGPVRGLGRRRRHLLRQRRERLPQLAGDAGGRARRSPPLPRVLQRLGRDGDADRDRRRARAVMPAGG